MATTLFNKTINVDSYGGASNVFELKHTLKLNSQSNTSSNFTFSGTLSSDYGYSWSGFGSPYPYMKIQYRIKNGDTYESWTDVSTKNMSSFSSSVTFSKTIDIPHQNDGTLVIQPRLLLRPNNDGFSYLPASATITSSDITNIPTLHTPPTINGYTIEELNTKLIGIANNVFVENLSIKKFVIDATTYDNATISRYSVLNGTLPYSSETNGITIDFSQNTLEKDKVDSTKTPILVRVQDSMGSLTYYPSNNVLQADKYDYIPYTLPTLNNTETKVKRNGQTSGKVNLNAKGNFYNSNVGSVTQTLKIYFKYWEKGTDEPTTYNEIPSNNITVEKNTFDITNYELGKDFDYQKAYSVKIKVVDAFYEYEVIKSVPVGESTWTEYKDRVDFKKLTINGVEVTPGETILYHNDTGSSTSVTLSENATNFHDLTICFRNDNNGEFGSINVHEPATGSSKRLSISCLRLSSNGLAGATARATINGTTITLDGNRGIDGAFSTMATTYKVYITSVIGRNRK